MKLFRSLWVCAFSGGSLFAERRNRNTGRPSNWVFQGLWMTVSSLPTAYGLSLLFCSRC